MLSGQIGLSFAQGNSDIRSSALDKQYWWSAHMGGRICLSVSRYCIVL